MLYLFAKLGHFLGIILGVGGAIYSDYLLLQFLKQKDLNIAQLKNWKQLKTLVWVGLTLLSISGLLYFYSQYIENSEILYFNSQPFWAKISIFTVLVINFFIFQTKIVNKITSSHESNKNLVKVNFNYFKIALTISLTTWIYLLLLGTFRTITPKIFTYLQILEIYLAFLLLIYFIVQKKLK
jgi:hypothetical protein